MLSDLIMDIDKTTYSKGANNNNQESEAKQDKQEHSILRELLTIPTVDSQVLKHVYQFITTSPTNYQEFLNIWKNRYFTTKITEIDELVDKFYDLVAGEAFEIFINSQKDNYADAKVKLQNVIEDFQKKYAASDFLNIKLLEKIVFLLIVLSNDIMPPNFFLIFNFIWSKHCDEPDLKSHLLDALCELHLIGYDTSLDQEFMLI